MASFFVAGVFAAHAQAEITLVSQDTIYLEGEIQAGDFAKFQAAISKAQPPLTLVLNSPGGDLSEALKIAELVRSSWITTEVTSGLPSFESSFAFNLIDVPVVCDSACALIFSSGVVRLYQVQDEENGRPVLGFHRAFVDPTYNQNLSAADAQFLFEGATEAYTSALSKYGAPAGFIERVLETKSDQVLLVGADQFYAIYGDLRVFGDGIPWIEEYVSAKCGPHLTDEEYQVLDDNYENEIGKQLQDRLQSQNECRNKLRNEHQLEAIRSLSK